MAAVEQVGQSWGSDPALGAEAAVCPLPAQAALITWGSGWKSDKVKGCLFSKL